MALTTVRVPPPMAPAFAKAEAIVSAYFGRRVDDPAQGTIEISGERYLLVRAASLSVEFFSVVQDLYGPGRESEADAFARNMLFDLAHALGRSDAHDFHRNAQVEDPLDRLSAGPVHFAHAGWAKVDIHPESNPIANEEFFLRYDHLYSFEADAWIRATERGAHTHRGRISPPTPAKDPVCIMNAGYSSGWCEVSYGLALVATEVLCRARGDSACRFLMAPPDRIEAHVEKFMKGQAHAATARPAPEIPDFFARKRMEEELRKAHQDLERRVSERTDQLLRANALLKRQMVEREKIARQLRQAHKLEAIGRLSGGIAHDFNNLLAIFMTRGGLLERRLKQQLPAGDPALVDLTEMMLAGERAATLTQQLLAFGRGQMLGRDRVDLVAIVGDLSRSLVPLIGADIELSLETPACEVPIRADRGQLEQVVMNMVVNARDAMPSGGRLTLSVATECLEAAQRIATGELRPRAYAVLTVSDSGSGMDEETQGRMFDPFFTTKPEGKGTGLGLATVYGIVQQSEGGIAVDSALGRGTTFRIFFPLESATDASPPKVERTSLRPQVAAGSETLLLVEDEVHLRTAVAEILGDSGYRVIATATPADALRIAGDPARRIDLLITDLIMPKMGGVELARAVLGLRKGVRVLFVSGYAPDGAERDALMVDQRALFLPKPFQPDELLQRVRRLLDC